MALENIHQDYIAAKVDCNLAKTALSHPSNQEPSQLLEPHKL
ncbi:hypothetical protein CCACVL1_18175 [Corchorus capsularis]|uniref:Uncharacterized protein n=1 Tax=Corchorus capsularis TaxID=210143 RepID=A0A1R3HMP4_COCAP|nr:hypothetical protein CCACVL1_18175 [Corchorus capsularis]